LQINIKISPHDDISNPARNYLFI